MFAQATAEVYDKEFEEFVQLDDLTQLVNHKGKLVLYLASQSTSSAANTVGTIAAPISTAVSAPTPTAPSTESVALLKLKEEKPESTNGKSIYSQYCNGSANSKRESRTDQAVVAPVADADLDAANPGVHQGQVKEGLAQPTHTR